MRILTSKYIDGMTDKLENFITKINIEPDVEREKNIKHSIIEICGPMISSLILHPEINDLYLEIFLIVLLIMEKTIIMGEIDKSEAAELCSISRCYLKRAIKNLN